MRKLIYAAMLILLVKPAYSDSSEFTLVNHTPEDITSLSVARWNTTDPWSAYGDVNVPKNTGQQKIPFNKNHTGDACLYDLKIQFKNREVKSTIHRLNLCKVTRLVMWVDSDGKYSYDDDNDDGDDH
jgi:hypothetical protein